MFHQIAKKMMLTYYYLQKYFANTPWISINSHKLVSLFKRPGEKLGLSGPGHTYAWECELFHKPACTFFE
jgi:hypothetical protein